MKVQSVLELTPLLDILLIMLFGFMIHTKQLESQREEALDLTKAELEQMRETLAENERELERYRSTLSASELTISEYEQQIAHQQEVLSKTIEVISQKMGDFFELTAEEMEQKVQNGELAADDYEHYLEQVEALNLTDRRKIVEKVYILGELQDIASIVNIYIDSGNQVYLSGKPLGIALQGFDQELGDFPPEVKTAFSEQINDALMQFYESRRSGNQPLADVVLVTFGHSDQAMRGALRLGKDQLRAFYRDIALREAGARKVFFSDLGYYPFEP